MGWRTHHLTHILCWIIFGLMPLVVLSEEQPVQPIRIGVLAYRGIDQARQTWQGHANYLTAKLPGHTFTIVPLDYNGLTRAVRDRTIELLITNTGHYTELEATGEVSRIATRLIAGPSGPLNSFGGTAIALANRTDLNHYRDLSGKHLLIPDKSSLGGWQVHLREALAQQVNLEKDLASLKETENHEKVVQGILAGQADAGFIRSDLIEAMIANGKLQSGQLKVIDARTTAGYPYLHSTRLYPEWPFARVGNFSEKISKSVLVALLAMQPDDPAARQAHLYGWTLPQNYQPVLDLFREAGIGPYAHRIFTWDDIVSRYGTALLGAALLVVALLLAVVLIILRSNRLLHRSESSLRLAAGVFRHAEEGILITDAGGRIVQVNDSVCQMTGYGQDELIGRTPSMLRSHRQDDAFYRQLWQTLLTTGSWHGEMWNRRKDGSLYAQRTSISSIRERDGSITHFISLFSDITELKESQGQLERMAYYDALTGLPNRLLLADRLKQAIAQCNRRGDLLAVCYLDLDNFKPINDR